MSSRKMRFWVPVAVGGLIVLAYAVIYEIGLAESQGTSALGIANSVGLLAVFVGLIAAGFLLRRATPHR